MEQETRDYVASPKQACLEAAQEAFFGILTANAGAGLSTDNAIKELARGLLQLTYAMTASDEPPEP